jgi:hypothetical protein
MFRPRTVVVPNPEPEISKAEMEVVARPWTVVVEKYRFPPAFLVTQFAVPAPSVRIVDEATVKPLIPRMVVVPIPRYSVEVADCPTAG